MIIRPISLFQRVRLSELVSGFGWITAFVGTLMYPVLIKGSNPSNKNAAGKSSSQMSNGAICKLESIQEF